MGNALGADEKDQRHTAGPAGIEARQTLGIVGAQRVRVFLDDGLGQERQGLEIPRALYGTGIEARAGKQLPVIRNVRADIGQESLESLDLQGGDTLRRPPLGFFHLPPHAHGVVLLDALLERKDKLGDESGVEIRHGFFLFCRPRR